MAVETGSIMRRVESRKALKGFVPFIRVRENREGEEGGGKKMPLRDGPGYQSGPRPVRYQ